MKVFVQESPHKRVVSIDTGDREFRVTLGHSEDTPAAQLKRASQTLLCSARADLERANLYDRAARVLEGADAAKEPGAEELNGLINTCRDALDAMQEQLHQLQGLVDDKDGSVQEAIDKGDQALSSTTPNAIGLMLARLTAQAVDAPAQARDATRTEQQIVEETEKLAGMLMSWAHQREPAKEGGGYTFRHAEDTRGRSCWNMACQIQELLTQTDPENAVAETEG